MPPEQNPHHRRPILGRVPETEDPLKNNTPSQWEKPQTPPPNSFPKKEAVVVEELAEDVEQQKVVLDDLSKPELKSLAKERDLPVSGTKADLIERLS